MDRIKMSSRSILRNLQSEQEGLPVSRDHQNYGTSNSNNKRAKSDSNDEGGGGGYGGMNVGIRRRLSSLSLKIHQQLQQPISSSSSMGGRRSKSMSSLGEYAGNSIRKWWEWGWVWILSRKHPASAEDLEMNPPPAPHNQLGSWRHVFYKLKSELGKLVGAGTSRLPQTTT